MELGNLLLTCDIESLPDGAAEMLDQVGSAPKMDESEGGI